MLNRKTYFCDEYDAFANASPFTSVDRNQAADAATVAVIPTHTWDCNHRYDYMYTDVPRIDHAILHCAIAPMSSNCSDGTNARIADNSITTCDSTAHTQCPPLV